MKEERYSSAFLCKYLRKRIFCPTFEQDLCKNYSYVEKFEWTGSLADDRKGDVGPRQTVVTLENAAKVSGIVQQNPRKNILCIASPTGLKYTSMQKILKNSLWLFPYKIQSHQAIPMKVVKQSLRSRF